MTYGLPLRRSAPGRIVSAALFAVALHRAPAAHTVVCDNGLDKRDTCLFVHGFALTHLDCSSGLIVMPLIDDSFGIWCERVIDKDIDVVLGRQQGADVAFKYEVWTVGALDGFGHVWVGSCRLFDVLLSCVELEIVRVIDTLEATHIRYRIRR